MALFEGVNSTGLVVATLLPWWAGWITVRTLLGPAPNTILLGHGYVVGQLLIMLLLLAWNSAGLPLSFAPLVGLLAVPTLIATGLLSWRAIRQHQPRRPRLQWQQVLWLLPLAWFAWERGGALALELTLRPLSAWDAWMNWVPRAVVWFHHAELTAFDVPPAWLAADPSVELYTLGNWRAAAYPPGVPLVLLWQMLGAETHDHTLIYLPWLLLPSACALALWGHLRSLGLAAFAAALAVYALLSQPLLNIHMALAGYADLWLAVCFGMGIMALSRCQTHQQRRYLVLAALMALACSLIKTPGIAFSGLLLGGILLLVYRPSQRLLAWTAGITGTVICTGLTIGMFPGAAAAAGELLVLDLPWTLPTLRVQPSPLLPHLWDTMFVHANWHLLWLLLLASLWASLATLGAKSLNGIALIMLAGGFALLLSVFGFTQYFLEAENRVTFNRTLLYLVPAAVYVAFTQLHRTLAACESPAEQSA